MVRQRDILAHREVRKAEKTEQEKGLPGWDVPLGRTVHGGTDEIDDENFVFDKEQFDELSKRWQIYDDSREWAQLRLVEDEVRMINMMDILTDKVDWERKIEDDEIWAKWTTEAKLEAADGKIMEFCRKELRFRAQQAKVDGYIPLLGMGGADIVKSDTAVPEEFRLKLVDLLNELENDPRRKIDWHPGRENVVRNLVHPSLYPLRFGHTRILPDDVVPLGNSMTYTGQGTVIPAIDEEQELPSSYSREFQWLPAEIRFRGKSLEDGVQFTSYINNLEWPRYQTLYHGLEELLQHAIPLWNKCMATSMGDIARRIDVRDDEGLWGPPEDQREPPDVFEDSDEEHNLEESKEEYKRMGLDPQLAVDDHKETWDKMQRVELDPEPRDFESFREEASGEPEMDLFKLYREDGLQVIVKIAQIQLSPENPKYDGGSWHVEGLANEHICATAIYYYENTNITETRLNFRGGAMLPFGVIDYPQNEFQGLERVYGVDLRDDEQIQELVDVATRQGRLLAFPNVFQHCVPPFELEDSSKPGHRKMVLLWLVNPDKRIISTARVPPQQRERFEQYLREFASAKNMPAELAEMIATANTADLPTEAEAREQRVRLMAERSVPGSNYVQVTRTYDFCEH